MGYFGNEKVYEKVKGRKITGMTVENDSGVILTFEDGGRLTLALDGDCCSHSYYTDAKGQFGELVGATIQSIEEREGRSDTNCLPDTEPGSDYVPEDVKWYFLVFVTDRGHTTIDWRNDSNGYYSGSINPSLS